MSLRPKILIILLTVVALYAAVDFAIQRFVIFPSFLALERDEARKDLDRCAAAIDRECKALETFCDDWAAWDDTYQFVKDHNKEYVESNLVDETFTDNGLNLILIYDLAGRRVAGRIFDLSTEKCIEISQFPKSAQPADNPLLCDDRVKRNVTGIMATSAGPMLISAKPILTSENVGPVRGTLIMGRLLTKDRIESLGKQTLVDLHLWPIGSDSVPPLGPDPADRNVSPRIAANGGYFIREHSDTVLHVYTTYPDIHGKELLLMRADVPRDISARGQTSIRFAMLSTLLLALVVLLALVLLLQKTVISPLSRMARHAAAIGQNNDLTARLSIDRGDEFGKLGREFDQMLEQLDLAHRELLEYQKHLRSLAAELSLTEERQRRGLAASLHDSIGQDLFAIVANLEVLRKLDGAKDHWDLLGEIAALAEKAMRETRNLTFELCPPVLYESGLPAAMQWLVRQFQDRGDIAYRLVNDSPSVPLEEDVRSLLYQASRELLTNVSKHSEAKSAEVTIAATPDSLSITISDDGVGFDASGAVSGGKDTGFGLFSIRERLIAAGGRLEIISAPHKGTSVTMTVPTNKNSIDKEA